MNVVSRLKRNHTATLTKVSRLRRKILADWTQVSPADPNIIQLLTDAMTYGYPVQISYEGSGWRNIVPYGWNTSKDGNVLIMCYKDTGEVRSYRLDRVEDMYIDQTANGTQVSSNPEMTNDEQTDLDQVVPMEAPAPVDMPPIPGEEQSEIKPGEFDDELSILDNQPVQMEAPEQQPEQPTEQPIEQPVEENQQPTVEESEEEKDDQS